MFDAISQHVWRAALPWLSLLAAVTAGPASLTWGADWRDITTGTVIPDDNYSDQPYVVVLNDGSWLTTLTTGPGTEGSIGQHIVSTTSGDQGQTWSPLIDIEASVTDRHAESSWIVPLHVPNLGEPSKGRVFGFYTYNGDNVNLGRSDVVGWYAFKFSDDGGQTWSPRHRVPVPYTEIDLNNDVASVNGAPHMKGWGVSKPIVKDGQVHLGFTKVRTGLVDGGEGWVFSSANLLTEPDPSKISWTFSQDPNNAQPSVFTTDTPIATEANWTGLRNPSHGNIQEEHVVAPLAGPGELVMVNRTAQGFPALSYSRDNGKSWTMPTSLTYEPGGSRVVKNPRANVKVWRTEAGKYLLWHHNNGTTSYTNRNPAWVSAGVENSEGEIRWSEPEVLFYDPTVGTRISYPDLVEQNGQFWITETQKSVARVHQIDGAFLDKLFTWDTINQVSTENMVLDVDPIGGPQTLAMPRLSALSGLAPRGFSMDFWVNLDNLSAGQTIADNRDSTGKGFVVETTMDSRLQIVLNDGFRTASWDTDVGAVLAGTAQHIGVVVDGQADMISWVVNGKLLDGGGPRAFGWSRFNRFLGDMNGSNYLTVGAGVDGSIDKLRLYDAPLMTTELVGNFRQGIDIYGYTDEPQTVSVVERFRFDGSYSPDSTAPPEGQSTWTVVTTGGLAPVSNSPSASLTSFLDGSASGRIQMSNQFTDPAMILNPSLIEWEYTFSMSFTSKTGNNAVFGVRDEGGNGRFIMFAHSANGDLVYTGSDTVALSNGLLYASGIDGPSLADGLLHNYRVVKSSDQGVMRVGFYLDGLLLDVRDYADFSLDLNADNGFGVFLSTPGSSNYVIDSVYFGPIVAEPLVGDYNEDGKVDAADYTVWRDTVGSTDLLGADGDGDGVVNFGDWLVWSSQYGEANGDATSVSNTVPSPDASLLMQTCIGILGACHRHRQRRLLPHA